MEDTCQEDGHSCLSRTGLSVTDGRECLRHSGQAGMPVLLGTGERRAMKLILLALRHPMSVLVALVAVTLGCVLAVGRMGIDIFPALNLPVIYVAQPYGGMDPAQMEGFLGQLLRVSLPLYHGHSSRRVAEHSGPLPDAALLPSRHRHVAGDGRDGQLRESRPGVHAARHGLAVRDPFRHRQRAGRLPGALQRDPQHRRDPGPGAVPRAADVCQSAGRLRAAALRRQPANGGGHARSRPPAGLRHVARRGRRSP